MHAVIVHCRGQRYAIASATVVEVIPVVAARPIAGSAAWLTGLIDYRGDLVPLVDLAQLLGEPPAETRQSNRILVLQVDEEGTEGRGRLGLLVKHVLGTENLALEGATAASGPGHSSVEFLGPVARTSGGTVQLIVPARLPTTTLLNN